MTAYYNENDPKAAAWLRELIKHGYIAAGDVDERSVEDVTPNDLRGYAQCHFFAGIGGWSYALRLAGVADTERVWTGSCPCQPFSAAGKGAGFADERHLWPSFFHLITQCQPSVVFGEQVASPAGLNWLDLVFDDLEGAQYACGAADLCAAGVGAPHVRQRLYWVADHGRQGWGQVGSDAGGSREGSGSQGMGQRFEYGGSICLANSNSKRLEVRSEQQAWRQLPPIERSGEACKLGNAGSTGGGRNSGAILSSESQVERGLWRLSDVAKFAGWSDCDWLPCRDGKARPVEPGTFPLAHGVPGRVGLLRGYGNAIVPQVAAAFIEAAGVV